MIELWNPARLALGFVILFALFVPLRTLFPIVRRQFWQRPGVWADFTHFFVTGGIRKLLALFVVFGLIQALGFLVYPPLQQSLLALPRWSQFLIAIFIFELGTYWGHRWAHTMPFLWRFHAVHHSSEHLDWAAASRLHPVDQTFIRICGIIPGFTAGVSRSLLPVVWYPGPSVVQRPFLGLKHPDDYRQRDHRSQRAHHNRACRQRLIAL